jgi:hypothetical protein
MCNPLRDADDANADRVEDGVDNERLSENEIDSLNRNDRLFYPLTIPISEEEFELLSQSLAPFELDESRDTLSPRFVAAKQILCDIMWQRDHE